MNAEQCCLMHPSRRTVAACHRCGTFSCEICLSLIRTERICAACTRRAIEALPTLSDRASLARTGVYLAVGAGTAFRLITFAKWELALSVVTIPSLAASLFAAIVFLRWFHLAARWGHAVGAPISESPAYAVGSFFIPIVNWFTPYRIASALCETAPVGRWQLFWVSSQLLTFVALVPALGALGLISAGLKLVAALYALKVINEVTLTLTRGADVPSLANEKLHLLGTEGELVAVTNRPAGDLVFVRPEEGAVR